MFLAHFLVLSTLYFIYALNTGGCFFNELFLPLRETQIPRKTDAGAIVAKVSPFLRQGTIRYSLEIFMVKTQGRLGQAEN